MCGVSLQSILTAETFGKDYPDSLSMPPFFINFNENVIIPWPGFRVCACLVYLIRGIFLSCLS